MSAYYVHSDRDAGRVRCQCGNKTFATPEPPTDRYFSGRFWCMACGARWSTDNVVQTLSFVGVSA